MLKYMHKLKISFIYYNFIFIYRKKKKAEDQFLSWLNFNIMEIFKIKKSSDRYKVLDVNCKIT